MRVLAVLVSGAPVLGQRVPGGSRMPRRWLRGTGRCAGPDGTSRLAAGGGGGLTRHGQGVPRSRGGHAPGHGDAGAAAARPAAQRRSGGRQFILGGAGPQAAASRRAGRIQRPAARRNSRQGAVPGVRAAEPVDAARVRVNGSLAAVLGVDPSAFRRFAAKPTAMNTALWGNVANGAIAVSYTMGREAKLPAGSTVEVTGQHLETLQVGGLGTVGIPGVNAVAPMPPRARSASRRATRS